MYTNKPSYITAEGPRDFWDLKLWIFFYNINEILQFLDTGYSAYHFFFL